jgi:hypothetical protein
MTFTWSALNGAIRTTTAQLARWFCCTFATGTSSADPVLRPAEFAECSVGATSPAQQDGVNFAYESEREWEAAGDPEKPMLHRGDVVRDLLNIVNPNTGFCVIFKEQQIGKRRLRSLDLGRQERFFPDIEVKEELGVRKQGGQAIESAQRLIGTVKMLL